LKKFRDLGNYTQSMTPQKLADFVGSKRHERGPIVRQVASGAK
jgi:hypothetical protein